jgi:hypothetical protein
MKLLACPEGAQNSTWTCDSCRPAGNQGQAGAFLGQSPGHPDVMLGVPSMAKHQAEMVGSLPITTGLNPDVYLTAAENSMLRAEYYRELYTRLDISLPEEYRDESAGTADR